MKSKNFLNFIKFFFPFFIWMFLFSGIFSKEIILNNDGPAVYSLLRYFFSNISQGVFPLWNPFRFWGGSFLVELNAFGAFNPFWILILLLNSIGVQDYFSTVYILIGYFFFGQFGFYLLAKTVFKDSFYAYMAFLFSLFSSLGFSISYYPFYVMIFVPAVWFFYFLINFAYRPIPKFFVGIIFCLMIIINCYLPLYWLTVVCLFFFFSLFFYFFLLKIHLKNIVLFVKKYKILFLVCFCALFFSSIASMKTYLMVSSGDVLNMDRRISDEDPYASGAATSYRLIKNTSPSTMLFLDNIFLSKVGIIPSTAAFFYISFFAWIVLFLSVFNRINKKTFFLIFLMISLFFLMIGEQTIFFKKAFDFFFWLSLIRDFGTFIVFFIPLFILFIVFQLKLIEKNLLTNNKFLWISYLTLLHLVILYVSIKNNSVISTQATIFLSFLFFILQFFQSSRNTFFRYFFLSLLIMVHPIEIIGGLQGYLKNRTIDTHADTLRSFFYPPKKIEFSFYRENGQAEDYSFMQANVDLNRLRETTGFTITGAGFPPRGSFYVFDNISYQARGQYLKNKFYIYDYVKIIDDKDRYVDLAERFWKENINLVFIFRDNKKEAILMPAEMIVNDLERVSDQARIVSCETEDFRIVSFDVNTIAIQTNFSESKLLVYTDSFTPDWHAFLDGQETPVYISNFAFKGVLIPPGLNTVEFRYLPLGGEKFYFFVFFLYWGIFCILIFLFLKDFNKSSALLKK